jgi:hypothetical protein
MENLIIKTIPTPNRNVVKVVTRVGDFNLIGINRGLHLWAELFNPDGEKFDGKFVYITGSDWIDWPAGLSNEEDFQYVASIILNQLGLTIDLEEDAESTEEDAESTEEDAESTEEDAESTEEDAESTEEDAESTEEDAESTEEDAESTEEEL